MLFRGGILAAATALVMAGLPAPAHANHHLVKIAEVYPGTLAAPDTEYVELEMTGSGQNVFGGSDSTVTLFGADGGAATHTEALNATLANGQSGRRVLVGVTGLNTTFGTVAAPDYPFAAGNYLTPGGGAACFKPDDGFGAGFTDCLSWGSYSGTTPSATGGNSSPAGITDGQALHRDRVDCGTALIDTNAPADFAESPPSPLNNAQPVPAGCPETTITRGPGARTTDRTPRFKFTANVAGATFECRVDGEPFAGCVSPHTTERLKLGKHTFRVAATGPGGTDSTPARTTFRIVRP